MSEELVRHSELDDDIRLAKALAQSGFYKDIKDAAAGVVKLRIARELGLGLRGISDVHIVEGKPTLSYQAILGMVRSYTGAHGTDRYSFRYVRRDEECVEIEWTINGEVIGVSKCDTNDAKRMGVDGKMNWRKYPRQMRTARAVTEGVNAFMPEVIGGSIYTPEELGDDSGNGGSVDGAAFGGEGGNTPKVASSDAILPADPPPVLTLKPAEKADQMANEAMATLDAAEETIEGELVDPTLGWEEACKQHFATLDAAGKRDAVALLRNAGYLPEEKMTAKEMYSILADTLGPRCVELDVVLGELA